VTLIIGIKGEERAYLIADTIVTGPAQVPAPFQSAFGREPYLLESGRAVREGTCKLFQLSANAAVAWCGHLGAARDFLNSLRTRCAFERDKPIGTLVLDTARVKAPLFDAFHSYSLVT